MFAWRPVKALLDPTCSSLCHCMLSWTRRKKVTIKVGLYQKRAYWNLEALSLPHISPPSKHFIQHLIRHQHW